MSAIDVNGRTMPDWSANPWHRNGVLLTALSVFLAFILTLSGAFDTDDLGLVHRLGLWLIVSALMVFQPVGMELVFARALPRTAVGRWVGKTLAILVSIPVIAVELHMLKFTPLLPKAPDPWIEFIPFVTLPVLAIGGFTIVLRLMWERAFLSVQDHTDTTATDPSQTSGTMGFENCVLSMRARDHYLEIITDHGRHFRRDRLADWVERLNAQPGLQVHRSWWVADRAVSCAIRNGRDYKLVLSTGEHAPVARSRIDGVRAVGWLDRVRDAEWDATA